MKSAISRTGGRWALWVTALFGAILVLSSELSFYKVSSSLDELSQRTSIATRFGEVLSQLRAAEASQRGFLLTGGHEYLVPYTQFAPVLKAETFDWLPGGTEEARGLRELVAKRLGELEETIRQYDAGNAAIAMELVRTGIGRDRMSSIDSVGQRLQQQQQSAMTAAMASMHRTLMAFRVAIAAAVAAAGAAVYMYLRQQRALRALLERERLLVSAEQARAAQEQDTLRAIGHEIRSPLQSLSAIHDKLGGDGQRYVKRMLRALDALYGASAPNLGLQAASIEVEDIDLRDFLERVARNAPDAGVESVTFSGPPSSVNVRADPAALEEVLSHLLSNAAHFRVPGSAIAIALSVEGRQVEVSVTNDGARISPAMLGRIFEYGVTDRPGDGAQGRGQGLFVAKTNVTRMGGSIRARNTATGVSVLFQLPCL